MMRDRFKVAPVFDGHENSGMIPTMLQYITIVETVYLPIFRNISEIYTFTMNSVCLQDIRTIPSSLFFIKKNT